MKAVINYGKTVLAGLTCAMLLGGCATPSSEADFGNSVRRMMDAQKYTPPSQAQHRLPVLDGQKAEASAQHYRKDAGSPARIYQDMGNGSDK